MKRIYLCALSDPVKQGHRFEQWIPILKNYEIELEISPLISKAASPKDKAQDFNHALRSCRYSWIFDVSGGNLANLVLPYIDYDVYKQAPTYYAAFSDGTSVVNALVTRANKKALLFPIWNQVELDHIVQIVRNDQCTSKIVPIQNGPQFTRHARVYGGNIRCFLKLAGTIYMPDLTNSYLFLESASTSWYAFNSMVHQLYQMGALDSIGGVIFGRFNQIEKEFGYDRQMMLTKMKQLFAELCPGRLLFFEAPQIGHIQDSEGIWISAGKPFYKQTDSAVMLKTPSAKSQPQPTKQTSNGQTKTPAAKSSPVLGATKKPTSTIIPAPDSQSRRMAFMKNRANQRKDK
ncbi:MAG: LD-carboxypeptidase [Erysipelotrichaceae bacterium]|nr:LD-carboxypeptidase [Erysipelotrichaceae bacterium]